MVSQRIEIPTLDNPGKSFVKDSKTELRGAPATTIEWMILAYVAGKGFFFLFEAMIPNVCCKDLGQMLLSLTQRLDMPFWKQVKLGNDQKMTQSERNSHSKIQVGKLNYIYYINNQVLIIREHIVS